MHVFQTRRLNERGDEIAVGNSSWDNDDISAKYRWRDRRGHWARGGEVPATCVPIMMAEIIKSGHLDRDSIDPDDLRLIQNFVSN